MIDSDKILSFLGQYAGDGLAVGEQMPPKKVNNAIDNFPISRSESVLALLDTTVMGSNKTGLAICAGGLHWKNDWTVKSAKTQLSWDEFLTVAIRRDGSDVYFGPQNVLGISGSSFGKDKLTLMLTELQKMLREMGAKTANPSAPVPAPGSGSPDRLWWIACKGEVHGPLVDHYLVPRLLEIGLDVDDCRFWHPQVSDWADISQFADLRERLVKFYPLPSPPGF